MKQYSYTTRQAYLFNVKEQPDYVFLFFEYSNQGKPYWRLTSRVKRICFKSSCTLVTTKNSQYTLDILSDTLSVIYKKIDFDAFLLCRQGYNPDEALSLVSIHKLLNTPTNKGIH
ncbi:hypothetical protein [Thalassotalea aquiviva]|uniref:hypothetical protein n=1 Tax=Thalassotalea aquiviva TaxID=3242415 RepID=UPI00352BB756